MLVTLLLGLAFYVLLSPTTTAPSPQHTLQTGDLVFVSPRMEDPRSSLDNAILATGAATIRWLRAHGVPVAGNQTVDHVALVLRNASGLFFVQALPPRVEVTAAIDFWQSILPTTTVFYGWLTDPSQRWRLAAAAVTVALGEVGTPYAQEFESPPAEFYCSSLVDWAFRQAAEGVDVFVPPPLHFTLLFEPRVFWQTYYARRNLTLPVNVSGSNPTLLLQSSAVTFAEFLLPIY